MKEFQKFERVGTTPHRSYYIPFAEKDTVRTKHGILDRTSSSRFTSLDGVWQIKECCGVDEFDIECELCETIDVPSSVQLKGYDQRQYLNTRYPFPVMPPYVPKKNPCWHYRKVFTIKSTKARFILMIP